MKRIQVAIPTGPFGILKLQDQEIGEVYVAPMKIQSCKSVGR